MHNHKTDIKRVSIVALTNGTVKAIEFNDLVLDGIDISFSVWDMDRLYRCTISGKMRETVEIDFVKLFNAVKVNLIDR